MKTLFSLLFVFSFHITFSQTFSFAGWQQVGSPQWRGRTFSKDGYTFTRTTGGNTMTARLSSTGGCTEVLDAGNVVKTTDCFVACDCSGSGPTYGPGNNAPTNSGSSLVIGMDWSNTTSSSTLDLAFTIGVSNPNFIIRDANTNNNFADLIVVSGVNCSGTTVFPSSVTGMSGGTAYNAATGTISQSIIDNTARGNGGSNITVNFTGTLTSIRIVYRSNPTIPVGSNPSAQFIYVGQIVSTLSACPLPIELNSFDGECNDETIYLNWATASEINNDYFDLEQGEDGVNFEKVAQVRGSGTVNTSSFYSSRTTVEKGKYFRLKQVDYDGQYSYSNIIHVGCGEENPIIYPNPFEDNLTIKLNDFYSKNYSIAIKDMNGHVVKYLEFFDQSVKPNVVLDLAELAKGLYIIEIVNLSDQSVIKKSKLSKI